jgi:hypothetical protein
MIYTFLHQRDPDDDAHQIRIDNAVDELNQNLMIRSSLTTICSQLIWVKLLQFTTFHFMPFAISSGLPDGHFESQIHGFLLNGSVLDVSRSAVG